MGVVSVEVGIDCDEHELVLTLAIDRPHALELRSRPGNYQPLICVGVEVKVSQSEVEVGLPGWDVRTPLVLGHKAEGSLAFQSGIIRQRAQRGPDLTTACDETTLGIVHDYILKRGISLSTLIVGDGEHDCIYAGSCIWVAASCDTRTINLCYRSF